MKDSTAQAITYWEKGQKANYQITTEKSKTKGSETPKKEIITYDVEITVLETTEKSNTIQWLYTDIKSDNQAPLMQKIMGLTKNMKVIYKTDEMGAFVEVVNWKEIKSYMTKSFSILKTELKDIPNMDKVIKQMEDLYSTKEMIEASAIKDIKLFHDLHGGKYKLNEVLSGKTQAPNMLGGNPFDAYYTLVLNNIQEKENTFTVKFTQEIDKKQLTDATFNYLKELSKTMKIDLPKRETFKDLKNETVTVSTLDGNGWVIQTEQTTTVLSEDTSKVDKLLIKRK